MPKQTFLSRFSLIIKRLEKSPATFSEIEVFLQRQSEWQDKTFIISKRTFQRDIKDIYEQLGFEIVFDKTKQCYKIAETPELQHSLRLIESYEMIHAINAANIYNKYVYFETRQPNGLEHFSGLLFAIQNKRIVSFIYYKYWDETLTKRTVHPLALKECQGRWYVLAVDTNDLILKTFGLDRMDELDIAKATYRQQYDFNFKEMFANFFGIINSECDAQIIQLAFNYEQGQYVKNYPLHHSQKIIKQTKKQIIFELQLSITYDFIQAILHFGEEVKVMHPLSLATTIKQVALAISKKYKF
ncbi:MAG: helix-turn-helix transcriptional regulator [Chitinophagaceae bacterium]